MKKKRRVFARIDVQEALYEHGWIGSFLWRDKQYLDIVSWEQVSAIWPTWTRTKGCYITYKEKSGQEGRMRLTRWIKDSTLLLQEIQARIYECEAAKVHRGL